MTPDISVVMSVYNGAADVAATIDSVLAQASSDFELIVVDDGSTDRTPVIAESYAARDARVRVTHLRRVGLTRALIVGCDEARGAFIARQDCGDRSAPGRLATQRALFDAQPNVVLATVGARFVGPGGEKLYDVAQRTQELRAGLSGESATTIHGPSHHGATMFRKSSYKAVGGYRDAFAVAQDLDLWLRLHEIGECVAIPGIFYNAALSVGAISHLRRPEQMLTTKTIIECARARRTGQSDAPLVAAWSAREMKTGPKGTVDEAGFYHFLGGVLRRRDPKTARDYYLRALRHSFWRPNTWLRLASTSLKAAASVRGGS